uniref:Uncharacterized protein n=1 Tax=Leersia perrieri TaxID=77586 RepID=A0A0D9XD23_9ORYZ
MPALLLLEEMVLDAATASGTTTDVSKGPGGVIGATRTMTIHIVHQLLPRLEFRLPDELSLFEI